MKFGKTLLAYEEDIKNAGICDWITSHTTGFSPLHRYEGTLEVIEDERKLVFRGKDKSTGKDFVLYIPFSKIRDVYLGFDEVFRIWDERAPWNKPLRIKYEEDGKFKTVYIFVAFKRFLRTTENRRLYEKLKRWL